MKHESASSSHRCEGMSWSCKHQRLGSCQAELLALYATVSNSNVDHYGQSPVLRGT